MCAPSSTGKSNQHAHRIFTISCASDILLWDITEFLSKYNNTVHIDTVCRLNHGSCSPTVMLSYSITKVVCSNHAGCSFFRVHFFACCLVLSQEQKFLSGENIFVQETANPAMQDPSVTYKERADSEKKRLNIFKVSEIEWLESQRTMQVM